MSRVRFEWNGDAIERALESAVTRAINDLVDEARDEAKAEHFTAWQNTPTKWSKEGGQLEEEIVSQHVESVKLTDAHTPDELTGRFGFSRKRGFYGLFHELGTVHEFEKPVIQPIGDRVFARLAEEIRRRFHP